MKVTIYTVPDCQFSKAEKEYLQAHNVAFEEKNLETNKEFLTEMLTISNNFAGTPVTKIEKDDGTIAVLKGYTKEEFDKIFGYEQPKEAVVNSAVNIPPKDTAATEPPTPPPPPQSPIPPQPPTPPTPPAAQPPTPPPPSTNNQPPTTNNQTDTSDALNSVLESLQSKATEPQTTTTPPSVTPTNQPQTPNQPPPNPPNIPEPDFK